MWHVFDGARDPAWQRATVVALASAGVASEPRDDGAVGGPGLLFVARVTDDTYELVRALSASGRERLLVAVPAEPALADGVAWRLLAHGASDVVAWAPTREVAAAVAARVERWAEIERLLASPVVATNLVGASAAWRTALRQLVEAALFTSAPVLITGETGTGKELAARLVHTLDRRPNKRELVVLDCTTVVPELAGSEFFGHERGAFTGAVAARDGAFALADGGTLFLDEVGELPPTLQAELLRAVQERTYKRVGSGAWRRSDFRLVSATNRDLPAEVERGAYRRDLYYRIAAVTCPLPPLRRRVEDVIPLATHFAAELRGGREPAVTFDDAVRDYLVRRDYPGNVRDLRQLVSRIMHRHVGDGAITVGDVPEDERPRDGAPADWRDAEFQGAIQRALALGVKLQDIGRAATETAVELALHGEPTVTGAARVLGVTNRALQMRRAARRRPDGDSAGDLLQ